MSTRPRRTTHHPRHDTAPALVAAVSSVAGEVGAATPEAWAITRSPGPVVGSVCTGYGGPDLGVLAAFGGGCIAWCADTDPHVAEILAARMPGVANLGDVRDIDWTAVEPVEVLTAGFPCQDISAAGRCGGIEKGQRSGLWTDIMAGIRLLRSALLVVENVAALRWRHGGLHKILGDLAEAGYDALWRCVRAADIGAAHRRERVFLLAWPHHGSTGGDAADTDCPRRLLQRHQRSQQAGWSLLAGPAATAAHPHRLGRQERHPPDPHRGPVPARRGPAAADASGDRRVPGLPGAAGLPGRPDAALGGSAPAHPAGERRHLVAVPDPTDQEPTPTAPPQPHLDWDDYSPAVQRWEHLLGRPAPCPTQPGRHGRPVLAPAFVEWLQGLPPGWVTSLPLPRTAQLRALGNGVVPHQAAHAVALLLADLAALLADTDARPGCEPEANAA